MRIEIILESDFLRANVAGEFSLKDAQQEFLTIMERIAQFNVQKVLIDARTATGSPEIIDRFFYSKFAAQTLWEYIIDRGVSPGTQFAYVLIEPLRDPQRFGETVALNRGMVLKTFDNVVDACDWLERT
jgi:hypothetical protein